ncbi:MAG: FAD-binding protein [Bacteroidaceae bacterium]|nr:FAD-binding protein [Bacteroidaceae bacterium]
MNLYHQFDLYKYNTMHLHCIADIVVFPESEKELIDFVLANSGELLILGAGSNVILPKKLHRTVVVMRDLSDSITIQDSIVTCSASVRIQKLIRTLQKQSLGGIEYLFSVPCTVGGAVYMNAGRGELFHQSIADKIIKVNCLNLETGELEVLTNNECQFGYRRSVFHDGKRMILSASFLMDCCSYDEVEQRINERLKHSKDFLDASKPSCGSVFLRCDSRIMSRLKGFRIGGACWSQKTENWITNDRNASNAEVILLIRLAQLLHRISGKTCVKEVITIKG